MASQQMGAASEIPELSRHSNHAETDARSHALGLRIIGKKIAKARSATRTPSNGHVPA